jgi:3,4-dihydroxy 2-butanone 4-phosphate synthase/GTP cyclohydrolase II
MNPKFADIQDIISDLSLGRLCILVDGKSRENEGDLIACASTITPAQVNFMAKHGRGLICLAMSKDEVERLNLVPMAKYNQCPHGTAFMVSIDAKEGITTGISAYDRAHTIRLASCPSSRISDFSSPGHIFPLEARSGGLFEREGHTEASVELSFLAGRGGSAVICEVMDENGTMMRLPRLVDFARLHDLKIGSIDALKRHLMENGKKAA